VEPKDLSISSSAGSKLSYFGHEFEVPWGDLVASQTNLEPKLNRVTLAFRSGLQVSVTGLPEKEFENAVATNFTSPQLFEPFVASEFGSEATRSDYEFLRKLYDFTPEKMNLWALSSAVHVRECMFLKIKSTLLLPRAADSGIFAVHNSTYKGFQQGSPQARPAEIVVDLFSEEGDSVEIIVRQTKYQDAAGVSQAEINRVIRSLRKVT
jgi:hypothetical protein